MEALRIQHLRCHSGEGRNPCPWSSAASIVRGGNLAPDVSNWWLSKVTRIAPGAGCGGQPRTWIPAGACPRARSDPGAGMTWAGWDAPPDKPLPKNLCPSPIASRILHPSPPLTRCRRSIGRGDWQPGSPGACVDADHRPVWRMVRAWFAARRSKCPGWLRPDRQPHHPPCPIPECVGGRLMRAQEKPDRVKWLSPLQ
jgi:hypothetical protein